MTFHIKKKKNLKTSNQIQFDFVWPKSHSQNETILSSNDVLSTTLDFSFTLIDILFFFSHIPKVYFDHYFNKLIQKKNVHIKSFFRNQLKFCLKFS